MKIATLSIGDELVTGEVVNTNASRIATLLLGRGIRVERHLTVGDDEPAIIEALNELALKSEAVIVTGGLGPTVDDVTAAAAARATGRLLVVSEEALAHLHTFRGKMESPTTRPLSDKQAMIPEGAAIIPNPGGTACGFRLVHHGSTLFFLPGVPSEMERMLGETVLPLLIERSGAERVVLTSFLNVFGISEPEADRLLAGVPTDRSVGMSICVTFPRIRITLRAEGDTTAEAEKTLRKAEEEVRERLGDAVFSEGEETMEEVVGKLLSGRGMTLALAESCTGGLIAQRITAVPGSSAYFLEGAVTYGNAAKTRLLGVPAAILEERGAVSAECAEAMAEGVRRASGSDLAVAVTGIAGPDGGTPEKPVGTVFISLAALDGCRTERFLFNGNRGEVRSITAWTALDWLRCYLEGMDPPAGKGS